MPANNERSSTQGAYVSYAPAGAYEIISTLQ